MSSYNENSSVVFGVNTGFVGCKHTEQFTLKDLGFDNESLADMTDDELDMELSDMNLEWVYGKVDRYWSIEE